jgi:acyl dehydratase
MTTHTVTKATISQFALALGESDLMCHSGCYAVGAGHPDVVAPPTYAIVPVLAEVARVVADTDLGLDFSRVLHRSQSFTHYRPLHAGDVVTATPRQVDVRTIRGSTIGRFAVDLTDRAGARVCSAVTTLVIRADGPPPPPRPTPASPDSIAVTIGPVDLAHYAEASGDHNPIHLDPAAAAALGLPTVIAHGMLVMGIALRVATCDTVRTTACEAVFTAPVPVSDDTTLLVTAARGHDRVRLDVCHDGHVVAQVQATCPQPFARNGTTP